MRAARCLSAPCNITVIGDPAGNLNPVHLLSQGSHRRSFRSRDSVLSCHLSKAPTRSSLGSGNLLFGLLRCGSTNGANPIRPGGATTVSSVLPNRPTTTETVFFTLDTVTWALHLLPPHCSRELPLDLSSDRSNDQSEMLESNQPDASLPKGVTLALSTISEVGIAGFEPASYPASKAGRVTGLPKIPKYHMWVLPPPPRIESPLSSLED